MIDRRQFSIGFGMLLGSGALLLTGCKPDPENGSASSNDQALAGNEYDPDMDEGVRFSEVMQDIEKRSGGRLGVALIDTGSNRRLGWRDDERFAMCSTFKSLLAAATLARIDKGDEQISRAVAIAKADIVAHSPVTAKAVGKTMTIGELCKATVTTSDNAAANLLLAPLGGAKAFNDYVRSIGDAVTRLDRPEPMLNEAASGDPRDTTSPMAIARDLETLLLGTALAPKSRQMLSDWLVANTTGDRRIRAGAPNGWKIGDKTGTGENGATNDIAILWPPSGKPVLLAIYLAESKAGTSANEAILADVTRAALGFVGENAMVQAGQPRH